MSRTVRDSPRAKNAHWAASSPSSLVTLASWLLRDCHSLLGETRRSVVAAKTKLSESKKNASDDEEIVPSFLQPRHQQSCHRQWLVSAFRCSFIR